MLRAHFDKISETEVSGWIADDADVEKVIQCDLVVDHVVVRPLWADLYREDLRQAGWGEGHHGFLINPRALLPERSSIHVGIGLQPVGYDHPGLWASVFFPSFVPREKVGEIARHRWKRDEADESLTWGARMSGATFVDVMQAHDAFTRDAVLVEVGCGYGRLLGTILERALPFRSFTGIELSEHRVRKLREKFGADKRIEFVAQDVAETRPATRPTAIFSSATFEHLYPDCTRALSSLSAAAAPRAQAFIDFLFDEDDGASGSMFAHFDGHYARKYAHEELRGIFREAGMTVTELRRLSLGTGHDGNEVVRLMVVAERS